MASSRSVGATQQSNNKRELLMMPPTQHQAATKYTESFEEWFAGFDIPDYGLRLFDDQPRSQMPVSYLFLGIHLPGTVSNHCPPSQASVSNRCPRCAEQGIETFVMKGKHCPRCGHPC